MNQSLAIRLSAEALLEILGSSRRADRVLTSLLNQNKRQIRSPERREITELTYSTLRYLGYHQSQLLGPKPEAHPVTHPASVTMDLAVGLITSELVRQGRSFLFSESPLPRFLPDRISATLRSRFPQLLTRLQKQVDPDQAVTASTPPWIRKRLEAAYGPPHAKDLVASLSNPAPLTLRTNRLKIDRDRLIRKLQAEGYGASPTILSPDGIRIEPRVNIFQSNHFKPGLFEVQDEASQLVSLLANPKPGQKVLDLAAGAGGKSIHLASLMHNKGTIVASDIADFKLAELRRRANRAGVFNIETHTLDGQPPDSWSRRFDLVLVDAPCSGSGTFRRNPDMKWRLTPEDLTRLIHLQKELLTQASTSVKPGGVLIYATCSLFKEENQDQAEWFRASQPCFQSLSFSDFSSPSMQPTLQTLRIEQTSTLQLSPLIHLCDGFFVAAFRRGT